MNKSSRVPGSIRRLRQGFWVGLMASVVLLLQGCDNELLSRIDRLEAEAAANAEAGAKFLAANAKRDGVVTTDSGLQYQVLQAGEGRSPTLEDRVRVHYRGTLIDGSEFDSSIARGKPSLFPLAGLIAGWQEVLPMMREGDRWQLYLPAKLAYGKRTPSTDIPPNSTLLFDMELLSVEPSLPAKESN